MLITYNGHSFDLPFLNKRLKYHNISFQFDSYRNFDLYRVVRSGRKSLGLENYKLKSIEKYLGINRDDTISGKESVLLYDLYEQNNIEELRNKILLHNYEDIKFLIPTLKILEHIPISITDNYFPFIFESAKLGILSDITYLKSESYISVTFSTSKTLKPIDYYNESYSYSTNNNMIKLTLPIFSIDNNETYTFIDIDALNLIDNKFNDLTYNEQLNYLLTTKKDILNKIVLLVDKHKLI